MRSIAILAFAALAAAQGTRTLTPGTRPFIVVNSPVVALMHCRVIDGTGAAPAADWNIIVEKGRITAAGPAASTPAPPGANQVDLAGFTVIPGLVGMHEHLFYPSGGRVPIYNEHAYSFPRLYLASGVTTMRTAGSLEPYTDLEVKKLIDAGRMPGPSMRVTGPYLEGAGSFTPQMHELSGPEDAARTVEYWISEGVTSFKAYMHITRAELKAAIDTAHKHGVKVTGHLCSVGFKEAAALGIDNLEHGILVDTEYVSGKRPDVCPATAATALSLQGAQVDETIRALVDAKVAVTSTLAVFEAMAAGRPPLEERFLDALSEPASVSYLSARARGTETAAAMLKPR